MIRGTPPAVIPRPPNGIWWVLVATPRVIPRGEIDHGYQTWEDPDLSWEVLQMYRDSVLWIGTDVSDDDPFDVSVYEYPRAVKLGPKIEPPKEEDKWYLKDESEEA